MARIGSVEIPVELETKSFEVQIATAEEEVRKLSRALETTEQMSPYKGQADDVEKLKLELEKAINKLIELQKRQNDANYKPNNNQLQEHSNRIEGIIKKVGKWALAIFGVRSAYNFVRQAASTIAQYDEQIGADLAYIRFALAMTLKPVVEWLIKAAYTILQLIGAIIQKITGKNIFKNSGAGAFEKAMKKSEKSSKKIKDNISSFDEINKVTDNKNKDDGFTAPSTDLSKIKDLEKMKLPKWMDWILTNWKKIAIGIGIIAGTFLVLKLVFSALTKTGAGKFFDGLAKALEIGVLLGGMALVIKELTDFLQAFSESGMSVTQVFSLLLTVLGTLTVAFIAMAAATKLFNIQGIIGAVAILGGLALILNQLKGLIIAIADSGMEMGDVIDLLNGILGTLLGFIVAITAASVILGSNPLALVAVAALTASLVATLLVMEKTLPVILDALGKFITNIAPPIIKIIKEIGNLIEKIIVALGKTLPPIIRAIGSVFKTVFNGINSVITTITKSIVTVLDKIIWFVENIGPAVEISVDALIRAVTKLVNFIIDAIEFAVNSTIIAGINKIIDGINKIGDKVGFTIKNVKELSLRRFTPKLASGAIINQPGRGVPVGGAIAGEAGKEGILPLTDSRAMEELGQEIGKYVTINNMINNYVDGRKLNQLLVKSKNKDNFARNGA